MFPNTQHVIEDVLLHYSQMLSFPREEAFLSPFCSRWTGAVGRAATPAEARGEPAAALAHPALTTACYSRFPSATLPAVQRLAANVLGSLKIPKDAILHLLQMYQCCCNRGS